MDYEFPNAWPLPDEYLIELGRISTLFSSLDATVNVSISSLSGYQETLDWRSAVLTAHANFKQRLDILETLCHALHFDFPHLTGYDEVIKKIKKAQTGRNKFAHQTLVYDPDSEKVTASSLSARGQIKPTVKTVTVKQLREISAQIHLAILALHELVTKARITPVWERNR